MQEVQWTKKTIVRKHCAAEKAAADPQSGSAGTAPLRRAFRRRKLRFSAACFHNPPGLLRYVSSSQKIFALQIFFGSPVLLGFPVISLFAFL